MSWIGASGCEQCVNARDLSDVCVLEGGELGGSIGVVCGGFLTEGLGSDRDW
jgi:hypothetical protein